MDDVLDLDAAAGLASLASSGMPIAPSGKGKPRAPCKATAAPKPKKTLTPEQRATESAKRKYRRHAADARDEAVAAAASVGETFDKTPRRRRLEMDAEKQTKMLGMEAEKQDKMLEIEGANAKTKAKEVALASMMTGVEIMKVDLNTVSPRKRLWFEKMQADMLKFTDE
nr:uncharacterized protein LOC109753967 [Aegilops tauschii subsp. strangulata]